MVRRSLAVATVCIGLAASARAQTVSGGVEAGGTVTTVSSAALNGVSVGATAGGFLTVPLTARWSLQPELLFVQKRDRVAAIGGGATTVERDYLELPLSFRFDFADGAVRPYLLVGPGLSVRLRTTPQSLSTGSTVTPALSIGGGVERRRWLIEGSLKSLAIWTDPTPPGSTTMKWGFSILAGRRF